MENKTCNGITQSGESCKNKVTSKSSCGRCKGLKLSLPNSFQEEMRIAREIDLAEKNAIDWVEQQIDQHQDRLVAKQRELIGLLEPLIPEENLPFRNMQNFVLNEEHHRVYTMVESSFGFVEEAHYMIEIKFPDGDKENLTNEASDFSELNDFMEENIEEAKDYLDNDYQGLTIRATVANPDEYGWSSGEVVWHDEFDNIAKTGPPDFVLTK